MLKYRYNTLPNIFENVFEKNDDNHSHDTRNKHLFRTPLIRPEYKRPTIRSTGVRVFNYLSHLIELDSKVDYSLKQFKTSLKALIIDSNLSMTCM